MYPYNIHIQSESRNHDYISFLLQRRILAIRMQRHFMHNHGYNHFLCVQREYFSIFQTSFYSSSLSLLSFFVFLSLSTISVFNKEYSLLVQCFQSTCTPILRSLLNFSREYLIMNYETYKTHHALSIKSSSFSGGSFMRHKFYYYT